MEKHYFCTNFLRPEKMDVNHRIRTLFTVIATVMGVLSISAQTPQCKDTAEHRRLELEMWTAGGQNDSEVLYEACRQFQKHAYAENDMYSVYQAWICGVMFNLGRMNIRDAYHITRQMGEDVGNDENAMEERYFVPNMMGHVYSTCGNISGAVEEFQKAVEEIKGSKYEADGLPFIYLALAHAQLNNDLHEAQRWVDETKAHLERYQDIPSYYRAKADAYAIEAIIKFKEHNIPAFRECMAVMEDADSKNTMPSGDIFLPYARIYQTLIDSNAENALKDAETLNNEKELYLVKCDIYNYLGDKDKAFLTQRELMHKRDSITGIMIIENLEKHEKEISLLKEQAKMSRRMNLILVHSVLLAVLAIVLMARNILMRRRSRRSLLEKNKELKEANRRVKVADEMKTDFMLSVSHEIRTPLNIINGFTQVLTNGENNFEPEERRHIAETIGSSTRQITSLVNKMLAIANNSTKDLLKEAEDIDALKVCQEVLDSMPPVDPELIKVEFEDLTQNKGTILRTNGDCLEQMLENILENSVKFTEKGYIKLTLRNDGRMMWFSVEDTGCGIPKDKISTIFDRFMKVDEFKEGLGLGLAYCHETTEKLGGELRLDRTSEEGTVFTLGLPIEVNKN